MIWDVLKRRRKISTMHVALRFSKSPLNNYDSAGCRGNSLPTIGLWPILTPMKEIWDLVLQTTSSYSGWSPQTFIFSNLQSITCLPTLVILRLPPWAMTFLFSTTRSGSRLLGWCNEFWCVTHTLFSIYFMWHVSCFEVELMYWTLCGCTELN